jgi:hypothetical protein
VKQQIGHVANPILLFEILSGHFGLSLPSKNQIFAVKWSLKALAFGGMKKI